MSAAAKRLELEQSEAEIDPCSPKTVSTSADGTWECWCTGSRREVC